MLRVKSAGRIKQYCLQEDTEEPKTVFHYRLPTLEAQQAIYGDIDITKMDENGELIFSMTPVKMDELLEACLVKIENIEYDGEVKTVELDTMARDKMRCVLGELGMNARMEISGQIVSEMSPEEELEKN